MIFLKNFFYVNLYLSTFVILSSILPTGFKSLFFYLSLISALFLIPIVFTKNYSNTISFLNYEKIGLILFGWIILSSYFFSPNFILAFDAIFEYRVFLISPLFAYIISVTEFRSDLFSTTLVVGGSTALLFSLLGAGQFIDFTGELRSLGGSIFHGFSMSVLLSAALFWSRERKGWHGLPWIFLAVLAVGSVFGVEIGRTAYLQMVSCLFLFIITDIKSKKTWQISLIIVGCLISSFFISTDLADTLNRTVTGAIERQPPGESVDWSSALRLDWWLYSLELLKDNWVLGIGLSEIPMYLDIGVSTGSIRFPTDNLHSEYLTIFLGTGIVGLLLLIFYFIIMFIEGFVLFAKHRSLSSYFLMVISTIFIVGCFFNSSLKDFGEKHMMICILSMATGLVLRASESGRVRLKAL